MTASKARTPACLKGPHCPEKAFALREASRRIRLLLLVLSEAELATDLAAKLSASRLALEKTSEVTAVLRRVITVLERCDERENAYASSARVAVDPVDGPGHR